MLLSSRTSRRSSSPRRASSLTRWRPTKPVPPVTSVLAIAAGMVERPQCPRPRSSPTRPHICRPSCSTEHDVHLVSLYVGIEGEQERESDIDDLHGFYERLRASDQTVTTSQPSVGDFISVYEPLLAEGKEIVSIHLSSGISGTYESAMQARERLTAEGKGGERIVVCDSRTGCRRDGTDDPRRPPTPPRRARSAAEANERAPRRLREELKIWFAVDTLDYLRRGGRIGAARAWIGTTLKIKPILTLEDEITPIERVRTRSRAFERMVDYARQRHEDGADAWVVQHVQDPENAAAAGRGLQADLRPRPGLHLRGRSGDRRPRRPRPARRRRRADVDSRVLKRVALTRALASARAPAPERDRSADQEADHRRADRELGPVLADLAAHVGHLDPAVAEGIDGARELLALLDDVVADLLGRARPGRRGRPAPVASGLKRPAGWWMRGCASAQAV